MDVIAAQTELDAESLDDTCWSCGGEGGCCDDWGQLHICTSCNGSGRAPSWMLPPVLTNRDWVAIVEAEMKEADALVAR